MCATLMPHTWPVIGAEQVVQTWFSEHLMLTSDWNKFCIHNSLSTLPNIISYMWHTLIYRISHISLAQLRYHTNQVLTWRATKWHFIQQPTIVNTTHTVSPTNACRPLVHERCPRVAQNRFHLHRAPELLFEHDAYIAWHPCTCVAAQNAHQFRIEG